tara:strand:+ start:2981 stop:3691 length:711 start_codon:yes stop_codon:yes gene_type:complete
MIWKTEAEKHAQDCFPQESCGLLAIINGQETYWPCKNLADNSIGFFIIDPDDWAECEDTGEIVGVVHSHPKGCATPSETDFKSCEHLGYPWYIFSLQEKYWHEFKPKGYDKKAEIIGRRWVWGLHDCWSVIHDWYEQEKNIKLKNWERPKNLKEFCKNPMFEKCAEETGFVLRNKNEDLEKGDVLLFEGSYKKLSHVGLYIGDQTILEHNLNQLSCRRIYDLNYIQATKKVYYYAA